MLTNTITATIRRTSRNRTGGVVVDSEVPVDGCVWWPGTSSEELENRDEVTAQSTLSMPYGTDVRPSDEVVLPDGTIWQVNGQPQPYQNPFTACRRGVIVNLQRSTG